MTHSDLPGNDDLTNVHQALQEASLESKSDKAMKNFSVRMPDQLKVTGQEICQRHGTDLGTFLRKCTEGLVKDYGHEPTDE